MPAANPAAAVSRGLIMIDNSIKYYYRKGRAYTEKPLLRPTISGFNSFVDFYYSHPSYKELSYLKPYLFGTFPKLSTWDVDIRLFGKVLEKDYEILANFLTDCAQFCIDSRFVLDICVWEDQYINIMEQCKDFNKNISQYKSGEKIWPTPFINYYSHLRVEECGKILSDHSKRRGQHIKQVSKNLWKITKNSTSQQKWINRGYMTIPRRLNKLDKDTHIVMQAKNLPDSIKNKYLEMFKNK